MPFQVIVADNFHYMDESESCEYGTFDTLELAVGAARRIVDECLAAAYTSGMSAAELFQRYVAFGKDPYIVAPGASGVLFSAWDYARERCALMCARDKAGASGQEQNGTTTPHRSFQPASHSSPHCAGTGDEPDRSEGSGDGEGKVSFDAAGVAYTPPGGASRRVAWADLRAVELVVTAGGPFAEDVFWVLRGTGPPLLIPQSANGSEGLLARLQELSGFDNQAVIAAMASVGNERFLCWARD